MGKIKVCALFRPLNSKERADHGDSVCIQHRDSESFIFKDEKAEELEFSFDKVFYPGSEQADVYEFVALPILLGAGKTYSMEGPGIISSDEEKTGLLPRVVNGLFEAIKLSDEVTNYVIKLSMVEIYMERIRDLFDLSKDNIQMKESKLHGINLSGVTETDFKIFRYQEHQFFSVCFPFYRLTLPTLQRHYEVYVGRCGKLMLVDLAGSEKVEKTGAEGRVLEEAKTINKSLSALGNVINALTSNQGKANHIPYRDSKLTRILQDTLGGNSQTGLLCCCSPSPSNIQESLSTLRFGARAKHIKAFINVACHEDSCTKKHDSLSLNTEESRERILIKLRENLKAEDVKLLEELFIMEGIFFDPNSVEEVESAYEDITSKTISSLQNAVEELSLQVKEVGITLFSTSLTTQNASLEARLQVTEISNMLKKEAKGNASFLSIAIDFNYPAVFNFGDSNSDTGGLVAGIGDRLDPPNGQNYFQKPSGRFCDGRLIIDFLMDAMELPFLNPYLDAIGAPIFKKGCNFAVAGSTILPATASSVSPFSFKRQVDQFFRFKARVLELLAKSKRNDKYIPAADYFQKGLYMFDIGQNDLAGAFYSKTFDQVLASIPTILAEFEDGIKELYDQGARNFWIHNTGPLGCLPQNIAKFGSDPSKLDELGCVSTHNQASRLLNLQLYALSKKLQGNYTDANVTHIDVFSIKWNLYTNYSKYGFEQTTTACCGYGGEPLNYDSRVPCGQTKVLNGTSITAKGCTDSSEYINWDGIHYTEAANKYVASQILTGKYSDPPFHDQMPFLLKLKF
ncbi:hypothetical protein M9H77_27746 [Catharanthus roseus]|uniref:Uncharacterized protein n=1 Tax=Catharanthus roseus TaxID=4058 RepID=A0ACC0AG36_CATRO|nr:hypothetical protein M9H77_27746 [Catharanthus roseus]